MNEMNADNFFWNNLPERNMYPEGNIIDRQKLNFDDIIKVMEQFAEREVKERAVWFAKCIASDIYYAGREGKPYTDIKIDKMFDEWYSNYKQQTNE